MNQALLRLVEEPHPDQLAPTIFHEPWWLEAASLGQYRELRATAGAKVTGRLPYVLKTLPGGLTLCTAPDFTPCLGPAIEAGRSSAANRALKQDGILRELLESLPKVTAFRQTLHRGLTDTLLFQDCGYRASVDFGHEIDPAPEARLLANMRAQTSEAIARGHNTYRVADSENPAVLAALHKAAGQNGKSLDALKAVCHAALQRQRGRIITAANTKGETTAALFYVWDNAASYCVLGTSGRRAAGNALSLLVWHAIRDSAARGLTFLADAKTTQAGIMFHAGFGGRVVPRYTAWRATKLHRAVSLLSRQHA